MRDRLKDAAVNQGYTPDGAERGAGKLTDHKEAYEHRRFTNDLCPSEEEMQGFRTFMDDFYMVFCLPQEICHIICHICTDTHRNAMLSQFRSFVLWL